MIDHDGARELAAAALDFELSTADRDALQAHLATCAPCRAYDDALQADARHIAALPAEDAPADARERILQAASAGAAVAAAAGTPEGPEAGETRPAAPPVARVQVLSRIPPRYRRPAAVMAAAAVILVVVSGTLFWQPGPTAPGTANADPSTGASGAPGSALPTVEPGSGLTAAGWTPVADLTADDESDGVVGLASGFRLASLDGTPAAELARRLTVAPPVEFTVMDNADGSARITPTEPLTPGAAYRFTLADDTGRTLDTWAFQAHQPLRVVATLPGDTETDIPLDTGIEVTFDQDGVVDAASHVTIEPDVEGRFEQHGRVLAFVPDRPLAPATIYTVTVSRGVEVGGTGELLESDVRFQFETGAAGGQSAPKTTFQFADDLFESATRSKPTIALWAFQDQPDDDQPPPAPTEARIEVHRLATLDAAIAAFREVRSFPRWARRATAELVPTASLDQVFAFDARLRDSEGVLWFELPERLPAGWYLVTLPSPTRPIQAMLQVTDLSGYLAVSETRTLIWTNDLTTGGPAVDATVAAEGASLGRTDAKGSLLVATPASLLPARDGPCTASCLPVVTVRMGDAAIFLPATGPRDTEGKGFELYPASEGVRYWHILDTDRDQYRRTDTVNAWGVVRDRDSGEVPGSVSIRLVTSVDQDADRAGPPLATTAVHPNAAGVFSASLALDDVPEGYYQLELRTAGELITSSGIRVDRILKPAYRLDVTTGRRVYFQGDQIRVTAHATFYEGTPVPGVPLRLDGFVEKSFTTDATGTAIVRTTALFDRDDEFESGEPEMRVVGVSPARAEEGEITGASREILVFPSSWTIAATTEVRTGRVRVTGDLHVVDRDGLEREIAAGKDPWAIDRAGAPVSGTTVTATFIEIVPTRQRVGTRYDFIEKKVVPVYEYDSFERAAGTVKVRTEADGDFAASIPASGDGHSYRIRLTATDPDRHVARWAGWADEVVSADFQEIRQATLGPTTGPDNGDRSFGVGETVDLTMSDPTVAASPKDRYLFLTAQRGIRVIAIQSSPRFRTTFESWAPPGMYVTGIRFTGSAYVESPDFYASFRVRDRGLQVDLTSDAPRYAPGGTVTIAVAVHDQAGDPQAGTVVLRAVDEKLFTMGAATAADPLNELYAGVPMGIQATYRSHRAPRSNNDNGGGDTTGGGGRDDFRDTVLFRSVETGADGRASVTFNLSDDLTSWRVSASALGANLRAGEGTVQIPVGLPFFADATIAPEYVVSDRPEIGLRAFGTALTAGTPVTFAVDSDSLGLHRSGIGADAFEVVNVALPKLTLGRHEVTITARTGSGASVREDRLTRTFTVVASRLARTRTTYQEPTAPTRLEGGDDRTEVLVSDAGGGRYTALLLDLSGKQSARLERALAAAVANSLAIERFKLGDAVALVDFDGDTYQAPNGGISLVPYSSPDLEVSALAAIVAPDRFARGPLESYLSAMATNVGETRERRNYALAGLAGLGAGVLPEIRAAAAVPDLTIRERLMLGLGAAALGDAATARSIAAALTAADGESLGDQARLRVSDDQAEVAAATALMAMLAAANGDPIAPRYWAYVEAAPSIEVPYELHAVGFIGRLLDRAAPRPASFAYVVDGERTVVELAAGDTFRMSLTDEHLADLTIEPVTGQIGVTTTWREPVAASTLEKDPDLSVQRSVAPAGAIGSADLVTVVLTVDLGSNPPTGCHNVTEIVPSGLLAVGSLQAWVDPDSEETAPVPGGFHQPFAQVGQRLSFCAEKDITGNVKHLRYYARVVTPGTYTWEPAVVESRTGADRAALTKAAVVEIR